VTTATPALGTTFSFSNAHPSDAVTADPQSAHAPRAPLVLLIDDDAVVEVLARTIRSLHLEVVSASEGRLALAIANRVRFNLLLLHVPLRDTPGLELIRTLHRQGCRIPFIVLAANPTAPLAHEARALGALDVLEEPIHLEELGAAVAHAVGARESERPASTIDFSWTESLRSLREHAFPPMPEPHTACERWCHFVISLATSELDLKTNAECARHVGVCQSVFAESCRRVRLTAEHTRNFSRALRAIDLLNRQDWVPETVLAIDDGRTLKRFETRSGVIRERNARGRRPRTPTLDEFFERQQWLPRDNAALLAFQRMLSGGKR
jgi:CheY-like chemotaxis protein